MSKPRLLDLFCGAGGAARGYQEAGFEVIGVDIDGKLDQDTSFVQVTGGGNCTIANARDAMGIAWMSKAEINEAIPPAYTRFVGEQLLEHLELDRV